LTPAKKVTWSSSFDQFEGGFEGQTSVLDEKCDAERAGQRVAVGRVCRSGLGPEAELAGPSAALVVRRRLDQDDTAGATDAVNGIWDPMWRLKK
jgi:hypothetical protein